MTDEKPPSKQASWLDRLAHALSPTPDNRVELREILQKSHESQIIDADALQIMEGALRVGELHAREIMIPRPQMELINLNSPPEEVLRQVIDSGHSRFPVYDESPDDIIGILLAKDLLPLILKGSDDFCLKDSLRDASIIPESKRLSVLLRHFREHRYHMAIVVDEYGTVSGLITIEDILEEIVGEIEDETDEEEIDNISRVNDRQFLVAAQTTIEEFNQFFGSQHQHEDYDTIAGILIHQLGHVPKTGETVTLDTMQFEVVESDGRRIESLHVHLAEALET